MRNFIKTIIQKLDNIGEATNYLLRDTETIIENQEEFNTRITKLEAFISQLTISEDVLEDTREAKVITKEDGSEIVEPTKTIDSVPRFTSVDDIDATILAKAKLELQHNG